MINGINLAAEDLKGQQKKLMQIVLSLLDVPSNIFSSNA